MTAGLNVLYLANLLPYPLDAGAKVRIYHTLQYLSQTHRVTLASFVRDGDTFKASEHLATLCQRLVTVPMRRSRLSDARALATSLLGRQSFFIARDRVAAMQAAILSLVSQARYDVVHADQLSMAAYGLAARQAAHASGDAPRLVLDLHNAYYLIPRRMADSSGNPLARAWLLQESRRLAAYEAAMGRAYDRVVTVTHEDRQALQKLYGGGAAAPPFAVIPICLDTEQVAPAAPRPSAPNLLFVGGMHWPPNADGVQWFARDVLPQIRARLPGAQFIAVGKAPPAVAGHGISLPGYVADAAPFWAEARAFVVPLRAGGGMRVKIVEAWARGVPVVSTTIGAEGLEAVDGGNILIADSAGEMAEAAWRILTDDDLAGRLSHGGRETATATYHWRQAYAAWDEVYGPAPDGPQTKAPLL